MPKISLAGFKDKERRPRYIIWSGVATVTLALLVIVALGVTSTYWFCANACHKVQDDTIIAYDSSAHSEVSCMACHMPVGADPITFLLHKTEALGELYLTATNTFELPLNSGSHLALDGDHMGSEQCTQCHGPNREITPSPGILIDHDVHEENEVHCAVCHNRVAHPEDFELTLAGNSKHEDFMTMTACFRCHSQDEESEAPGACDACHTPEFELKPDNHFEVGFYQKGGESAGHAAMSREGASSSSEGTGSSEAGDGMQSGGLSDSHDSDGHALDLVAAAEVYYCGTCHAEDFCTSCHGVPMPHPAGFEEGHGDIGRTSPAVCSNCHALGDAAGTETTAFCDSCHHPEADPTLPWIPQHFRVVRVSGAQACFDCHKPTYCATCHVRGVVE